MPAPQWVTSAGSLGTISESIATSLHVTAINASTYTVISGSLPPGLLLLSNTGLISGIPASVPQLTLYQFVVRAANSYGITDRTFSITVNGSDQPQWVTPAGFLPVGPEGQMYAVNRQYVDYQVNAITDVLPAGQKIRYYIGDMEGELPPGLTLTEDGRLFGILTDNLKLDEQANDAGGYDSGAYSLYPYDYATQTQGIYIKPEYVNKIYQFYITATDGISSSKQLFRIRVEDIQYYFNETNHLIPPYWITESDLGSVRADNNQVIELSVYDASPADNSISYDWISPTANVDGSPIRKPPYFELDSNSGALYATIPYQPAYNQNYKFTVRAIKTDQKSETLAYRDKTFTLVIQGSANNNITFITDNKLEDIYVGQQSELKIVAYNTIETVAVRYEVVNGGLPLGMSLAFNGNIIGVPSAPGTYYFTVKATDAYQSGSATKDFTLVVLGSPSTSYTNIYVAPFADSTAREKFKDIVTNLTIFDPKIIYRKNDPAFGVQKDIKVYLEYGVEKVYLNVFADELRKFFYRKSIYFGNVVSLKATNAEGEHTHDVICIEMVDPVFPNVADAIVTQDKTIYANSLVNMRERINAIKVEGRPIVIDEYLTPSFMRSVQTDGYIYGNRPVVILGYVIPGYGNSVVKKINQLAVDLKEIHFDIDRMVVEDTLEGTGPKYLFFPRKTAETENSLEYTSYIIDDATGEELYTEDGELLFAELTETTKYSDTNGRYLLQENSGIILTETNEYIELE